MARNVQRLDLPSRLNDLLLVAAAIVLSVALAVVWTALAARPAPDPGACLTQRSAGGAINLLCPLPQSATTPERTIIVSAP